MENMEENMVETMNYSDKYLPIGTVVLLKDGRKKIMIIGYKAKLINKLSELNDIVWDYSGCIYPEGLMSSDQILLFNHSQIIQIFHVGFQDEEGKEFKKRLNINHP